MVKKKNTLMVRTRPAIVVNRKKLQVSLALFIEFSNPLIHASDIRREAYKKQRYTDALTTLFSVIPRHDYPRALYQGGKYIVRKLTTVINQRKPFLRTAWKT